ncbi:MAG: hypothetical protein WCJ40_18215 [Planctomycetota bacterium]
MTQTSVRYLGSRELHRELPRILEELNDSSTRLVLTIHSKPRAVIIGAEAFSELVRQVCELDQKLGEELLDLTKTDSGKLSAEKQKEKEKEKARSSSKNLTKKPVKSRRKERSKVAG